MIHKRIKIVTILLIFILLFNFIIEPNQKSHAVGATISSIYGADKAVKLIAFILAAMTAGVTFDALDEAEKMFDKWQVDPNNWEPPDDNWKNVIKQLFVLGSTGYVFGDLINKIKDFFQGLGAIEGLNVIEGDYHIIFDNPDITSKVWTALDARPTVITFNGKSIHIRFTGKDYMSTEQGTLTVLFYDGTVLSKSYPDIPYPWRSTRIDAPYGYFTCTWNERNNGKITVGDGGGLSVQYNIPTDPVIDNPEIVDSVTYNVEPDSIILFDRDPFEIPDWYQPNIKDIVDTKEVINPQGQLETIYEGTEEQLYDELIDKITWEDLKQSEKREPYVFTETQSGTKIETGQATTAPYPDIEVEPIEDTSQFQGENIGLLKSIINWLSNIRNEIVNLPNKLFEIPEDLSLDTSKLRLNGFQDKFPFSIPWDIGRAIGVFAKSPTEPDLTIDIDTDYLQVNHSIDISRIDVPLRFARYAVSVFFILFLANKTRDLIKW